MFLNGIPKVSSILALLLSSMLWLMKAVCYVHVYNRVTMHSYRYYGHYLMDYTGSAPAYTATAATAACAQNI